jgi:hypothetical protein
MASNTFDCRVWNRPGSFVAQGGDVRRAEGRNRILHERRNMILKVRPVNPVVELPLRETAGQDAQLL